MYIYIHIFIHVYIYIYNKGFGEYNGFMSKPPTTRRNRVSAITQKPPDGLFSNLVHTLIVILP